MTFEICVPAGAVTQIVHRSARGVPGVAMCGHRAGQGRADLRWVTVKGAESADIPFDERLALVEEVVEPGCAALRAH